MKSMLAISFAIIVLAISCASPTIPTSTPAPSATPTPSATPPATPAVKPLASVSISGARGLAITKKTAASSGLSRGVTSYGDAGALAIISASGSTGEAVWSDVDGNAMAVNVSQAKIIGGYVLVQYVYAGTSYTATISTATGALVVMPRSPGNWNMIRSIGTKMYYVSSGGLYATDMATGSDFKYKSALDFPNLNASGWIHVNSNGNVWFVYTANMGTNDCFKLFFADGRDPFDFDGNGQARYIVDYYLAGYNIPHGLRTVADNGNDAYVIRFGGPSLFAEETYFQISVSRLVFNDVDLSASLVIQLGALTIYDMPVVAGVTRPGGQQHTHAGLDDSLANSLWVSYGYMWKFSPNSDGTVTTTCWTNGSMPISTMLNGVNYNQAITNLLYTGSDLYIGPDYSGGPHTISHVNLSSGGGAATVDELVSDVGLTSWTVTGGKLLFTNGSATYEQSAQPSQTPVVYSSVPIRVQGL